MQMQKAFAFASKCKKTSSLSLSLFLSFSLFFSPDFSRVHLYAVGPALLPTRDDGVVGKLERGLQERLRAQRDGLYRLSYGSSNNIVRNLKKCQKNAVF